MNLPNHANGSNLRRLHKLRLVQQIAKRKSLGYRHNLLSEVLSNQLFPLIFKSFSFKAASWESQIESRRPEEATEAAPEADVQSSPIDTEVYSVNPESAVETTFPQTDYR